MAKEKKPVRKRKIAKPVDHSDEGVKVSVSRRDNYYKTEETVKGDALQEDYDNKENPMNKNQTMVGLSKGYSFNMGNFESAKISCWITVPCENNDEAIMDELARLSSLLDEQIEFEANELDGD